MAQLNFDFTLKVKMEGLMTACKKVVKAFQEFSDALDELEKAEIVIYEVKKEKKKWWQFWKKCLK